MSMALISTVSVGAGGATSIDFTSIPQTMTDLRLVVTARAVRSSWIAGLRLVFNGVTTGYTTRILYSDGSTAASNTDNNAAAGFSTADVNTANVFGSSEILILNYSGATNKTYTANGVGESNSGQSGLILASGLWSSTAAITSISIKAETDAAFYQYTTASLYGITKGSGGASVA